MSNLSFCVCISNPGYPSIRYYAVEYTYFPQSIILGRIPGYATELLNDLDDIEPLDALDQYESDEPPESPDQSDVLYSPDFIVLLDRDLLFIALFLN
ncbi:MAG: hypothetical protein EZS28_055498 [Streblomastix strix]|uniref:Uncharacterized protein n=1 Tax=Streblomastix strix TaxID=222440 RepID=A0A5J4Q1P3_9EUKA|nr:MAG: hypothetical protein EZS28_055498 [Streblomastix strix]